MAEVHETEITEVAGIGGLSTAREHLVREAYTMALYVSIVLLAALAALGESGDPAAMDATALVWGTTIGLALAHWVAFDLGARMASGGSRTREHLELVTAQILGALAVAVVVTVPLILLPDETERDFVRLELGLVIGVIGFLVARARGAHRVRAVLAGVGALVLASAVAAVKNFLVGH